MKYLQDKTQMTMLVTWLIEIYLNQLGELKEQQLESSPRYQTLQKEFQTFLKQTRVKVRKFETSLYCKQNYACKVGYFDITHKHSCPPRMSPLENIIKCKHLFLSCARIKIILLYCELSLINM